MFWESLATQFRVIGALLIREIHTRFGRENLGFGWILGEPLIFALPVLGMWSLIRARIEHGVPMLALMWTGYLPILLFRHIGGRSLMFVRVNVGLLYHRQVTIFDLFAARTLLEILSNIGALLVSGLLFFALGLLDPPRDWPLFYLGYFYHIWWSTTVGLIIGGLSERSELVEKIWMPFSYMYMAVSGFFFLAYWLPPAVRHWALLTPSVNCYEITRAGLFGAAVPTYGDPIYLNYVLSGLTLIGLLLMRDLRKYVVVE